MRKLMEHAGLLPARFALDWASAAEAARFVELITGFTSRIKALGPLGRPEGIGPDELKLKLAAAGSAVKSVKLRTQFGKLARDLRSASDYRQQVIEERMAGKLDEVIQREMERQQELTAGSS